ncbi:MAG: hypothetical protein PHG20_10330 [Geobacteraceae bacterium]|nr:hypothetical protein [Geobacteraceae bacterium]
MDYDFAVRWLTSNKWKIVNYAKKYAGYSPYDLKDLQSAANEAALIAARCAADAKTFPKIFWRRFQGLLRSFVPNPRDDRASASIPSYLCSPDIPTDLPEITPDCLDLTTESLLVSLKGRLPEKDWQLIYLTLGLSRDGKMSYAEIGAKLGCSKQNVVKALKRCLRDVQQMVDSGKVSRMIDWQEELAGLNSDFSVPWELSVNHGILEDLRESQLESESFPAPYGK